MHITASVGISLIIYLYFKSLTCAIISFLSGVFIDLDHIFDFYFNHGIKKYKLFFEKIYAADLRKIILALHSIEFLILSWLFILLYQSNKYWISFAIGYTQHMLFDQLANPIRLQGYSLLYRIYHKFEQEKIVKKSFLENGEVKHGPA